MSSGTVEQSQVRGCSTREIARLEQECGKRLPGPYVEFLSLMGRHGGGLFAGTDIFYPEPLSLHSEARELLIENEEDFTLPNDALVFEMHQGYEFMYFITGEGDDPPVYQYVEGQGPPERCWASITAFLEEMFKQNLNFYEDQLPR